MSGMLKGEVVSVDDAGSLVTNITSSQLAGVPRDDSAKVTCDGHETLGIYDADHGQPPMTLLAVVNGNGQLEITIVGESARAFLGIQVGSQVVVSW